MEKCEQVPPTVKSDHDSDPDWVALLQTLGRFRADKPTSDEQMGHEYKGWRYVNGTWCFKGRHYYHVMIRHSCGASSSSSTAAASTAEDRDRETRDTLRLMDRETMETMAVVNMPKKKRRTDDADVAVL